MPWPSLTLEAVAQIGAGNSAPQDPKLFSDGIVPFVRTSDVGRVRFGSLDDAEDWLNAAGATGLRRWPIGTILFPKSGASTFLNHRVITGIEACVVSHLATIVPNLERIDPRFLLYFLRTVDAKKLTQDQGYPSLRLPEIGAIRVPLPPLPEQKRIVAILDEAFTGIAKATANAQRNIASARELAQAFIETGLNDASSQDSLQMKLTELCALGRVITYGVIKLGEHITDGVPCLRTSNVRWLSVETEGMKCIRPSLSDEYKRTILRGGEVLVNVRGSLGGVATVTPEMVGWNVSREVAVVPLDVRRAYPDYIAFWVGRRTSQAWLTGVLKGATYTGINIEDLRELPVILPSIEKQRAISEHLHAGLSSARAAEQRYGDKLAALSELRASLLHRAFTGQLTNASAVAA
jgi:type I restriction enzyme S subunit